MDRESDIDAVDIFPEKLVKSLAPSWDRRSTTAVDKSPVTIVSGWIAFGQGRPVLFRNDSSKKKLALWQICFAVGLAFSLSGCRVFNGSWGRGDTSELSKRNLLSNQLVEKGNHHIAKKQFQKAAHYYRRALDANSSNGVAHNNLGLVFFYEHDFFQAAGAFEEASELMPEDPAPINNLGLVMEMVARPHEAIAFYSEAHQLAPNNAEYLGNLIRARIRMKEIDEELLDQLHSLLFIERRLEWQDWAREQLGLFQNPYLDRGPPKPDSDPLKNRRSETRNATSTAEQTEKSQVFSVDKDSKSLKLPERPSEELPYPTPIPIPAPLPDPMPNSFPGTVRDFESFDSDLERLE